VEIVFTGRNCHVSSMTFILKLNNIVTCCVEGRIEIPIAMQRIRITYPRIQLNYFYRQDSSGNQNNWGIVTT
jgi:hypothetical protein